MTTMITDSPTTALTTVDQQTPTTEGRPFEPVQPGRSAKSRRVLRWTATIAALGVGAVLAVTVFDRDRPDTPALNSDAGEATELDVRGIPTWWAHGPALNSDPGEATELDVRGIPTWWQ